MLKYEKRIREIIASILKTSESFEYYEVDSNLCNVGMDSISFVSIIVAIENEYDIEFPFNKLLISESGTITLLNQIIEETISNAGQEGKKK